MKQEELPSHLKEFQAEEAELAWRLLNLRQEPSPALQQRVRAVPRPVEHPARAVVPRLAGLAGALLVILLLFASPTAQAMLGAMEKAIGQIQLLVMDAWPQQSQADLMDSQVVSLAEAQAMVPFALVTPAYLPARLAGSDSQVSITHLAVPLVKMQWRDPAGGVIQLTARPQSSDSSPAETLVGPASSEAVLINGQEAVLIRGAWDQDTGDWGYQDQVTTLVWRAGGVQYRLLAASTDLPLAELIAIAESIR
jgi:hypothetical protein